MNVFERMFVIAIRLNETPPDCLLFGGRFFFFGGVFSPHRLEVFPGKACCEGAPSHKPLDRHDVSCENRPVIATQQGLRDVDS